MPQVGSMTTRNEDEAPRRSRAEALAELAACEEAIRRGDHGAVRRTCRRLAEDDDPKVAREAMALLVRTDVDPAQLVILGLSFSFFVGVVWRYFVSG